MTIVDMHALCLLAVPIGTALLAWRAGFEKPDLLERGLWALAAGVAWIIVLFVTTALTPWYPLWQWAIPGICLIFTVVVVRSDRGAVFGAIAIAGSGIALIMHAWSFDSRDGRARFDYSGRLSDGLRERSAARSILHEYEFRNGKKLELPPTEGWLEELSPEIREMIPRTFLGESSDKYGRRWHSRLTGLLEPVGTQRLGIWITSSGEVTVRAR